MVEFENIYQLGMEKIGNRLEEFICESSGWMMEDIKNINLSISRYLPIRGSSYFATPARLVRKMAILNIINRDRYCFLYSVFAHLYPAKINNNRASQYKKYLENINYEGIQMPMAVEDIPKFEKMNPNIALNIFKCEEDGENLHPVRVTDRRDVDPINLY